MNEPNEQAANGRTVVDAAYATLKDGIKPDLVAIKRPTHTEGAILLVPAGMKEIDVKAHLDKYLPAPERRKGEANFTDLDSFIEYTARFASDPSVIFAVNDRSAPKLRSVFNHHPAGNDETAAGWTDHRAVYNFPLSEEWKAWTAKDTKPMTQAEFAEFIEDRVLDIQSPQQAMDGATGEITVNMPTQVTRFLAAINGRCATQAEMVTLSRGLKLHVGEKVAQNFNLQSGEQAVAFESTHTAPDGGKVNVPDVFMLGIPVFNGGPLYAVVARLRYRRADAGLVWFYQLHRPDMNFDHAFNEAMDRAHAETKLPVFIGNL